jgi:hypothetical protein
MSLIVNSVRIASLKCFRLAQARTNICPFSQTRLAQSFTDALTICGIIKLPKSH